MVYFGGYNKYLKKKSLNKYNFALVNTLFEVEKFFK